MDVVLLGHSSRWEPSYCYGLGRIKAFLNSRLPQAQVLLLDHQAADDEDEDLEKIVAANPKVVGLGTYLWNLPRVVRLAPRLRAALPDALVVLGGNSVSAYDRVKAPGPGPHFVIQGDGERVFSHLVEQALSGALAAPPEGPPAFYTQAHDITCLDDLGSPYLMGLQKPEIQMIRLETSRGCLFHCAFCVHSTKPGGMNYFSIPFLEKEFRWILEQGYSIVQIVDTALNYHTERLAELSALMTRVDPAQRLEYDICLHTDYLNDQQFESLKRFRAWNILVGMNSINPDTFKALKRRVQPDRFARSVSRLSKEIFRPVVSVLLGLPGDTVEGFRRTLDFCAGLDVHVDINELLVVPETSYFENADQLGLVFDLERSGKVVHGPTLSAEDLKAMAAMADEYVTRHKGDARRWRFMRAYQTDEKLTVPWRLSQHLSRLGIGGAVSSRPFALEGWRLEAVDEDFHPDTLCLNFSRSGEALLRVLLSPANAGQGSFAHTRFFNVSFATDAPGGLTPPGVLRFMERFSHVVKEAEARLPQAG